jgi:hypothetical protein
MAPPSWPRYTILTLMTVVAISACLLAAVAQGDGEFVILVFAGFLELVLFRLMVPVRPAKEGRR